MCIQWNPSNLDTIGTEESVHISEVLFQGLKCMQELPSWGNKKCSYQRGVLILGVSLERGSTISANYT